AAEPGAPDAADAVELVDEDDARGALLGVLEELAHARGADADEDLDELRRRDVEERHLGLARESSGEHGFPRSRRALQQDAVGYLRAQASVAVGVAQELEKLGHFGLGVVLTGDVGEAHLRHGVRLHLPRSPAEEVIEATAPESAGQAARYAP